MNELNDAVIEQHAKALKLPTLRREYGGLARRARADSWSYEEYLRELLDAEVLAREASTVARRMREARFPDLKLEQVQLHRVAFVWRRLPLAHQATAARRHSTNRLSAQPLQKP